MTEIRELVRRLKDYRPPPMRHHPICDEAAEALTSLSIQVEALKVERTSLIETKREQIARLTRDNEMNSMRAAAAEARVAVLEEALRPMLARNMTSRMERKGLYVLACVVVGFVVIAGIELVQWAVGVLG